MHKLEKQIQEKPEYWLWSHKRWKDQPSKEDIIHNKTYVPTPVFDTLDSTIDLYRTAQQSLESKKIITTWLGFA